MQIKFVKKQDKSQLICERKDGSVEIIPLGPSLPAHDIAHYVIEREFLLKEGFYGNIYNGYTIQQLSDKETIKQLGVETAVAEISTRALQSLSTGACTVEQFRDLIYEEFGKFSIVYPLSFTEETVWEMLFRYDSLLEQLKVLKEGETISMYLDI
jgi:hypothetical protein